MRRDHKINGCFISSIFILSEYLLPFFLEFRLSPERIGVLFVASLIMAIKRLIVDH